MSRARVSGQSGHPGRAAKPAEAAKNGIELGGLVMHHSDPLAALTDLREIRSQAEQMTGVYVARARRAGRSWTEIGYHLGVSAQAVHKRYGR
jgi:hypothetical protein